MDIHTIMLTPLIFGWIKRFLLISAIISCIVLCYCATEKSMVLRPEEDLGGDETEEAIDLSIDSKRIAEENIIIARIVEYGGSEACLAWLEQNFHMLGPGHKRVEELTYCATEELVKLTKEALSEGQLEMCKELFSRAEENCPEYPGLEDLRKAISEKEKHM